MKKIIKRILLLLICMLVSYYLACMVAVIPVIVYAHKIFTGEITTDQHDDVLFDYYHYEDEGEDPISVKCYIIPYFVLHDFKKGSIHVSYSVERYDGSNGDLLHGARHINSCWKIKKEDGIWKVTEVLEAP